MTKTEKLQEVATILTETGHEDLANFITEEAKRVEKLNTKRRSTKSKARKENEEKAALVQTWFETDADEETAYTIQEIDAAVGLGGLTPQKTSAILKLVGIVEKVDQATNSKAHVGYKLIK